MSYQYENQSQINVRKTKCTKQKSEQIWTKFVKSGKRTQILENEAAVFELDPTLYIMYIVQDAKFMPC